jgi:ADP-heptose:LPS heptosyltransferase
VKPHVLVARQDSEGDVLLAGPAIRAIAAGARAVTLLCGPRGEQAARLLPGVDRMLVAHAEWIDAEPLPVDPARTARLVAAVREAAPDVAVVLTSFHQSPLPLALLLRLAGVPRIGATSVDYPGSLLDVRHRVADDDSHEVQRALSLAAAMGFSLPAGDDGRLAVRPGPPAQAPFGGEGYVVVHPGASVPARAWEPERHAELVDALLERGTKVAVTGAPGERELTAGVARAPRDGVADLGGRTSLAQLAGVLAGADAVVIGNTGPAHLAAAVGTPVVSLFAPTVPAARWRPWGVPHEVLFHEVLCAGCRARECPVPNHPCLHRVGAGEVLAALDRLTPARARALEAVA